MYTSTLLAQSNDPVEIQKADIDLLKKINELDKKINTIQLTISNAKGIITSSYTESDNVTRSFSTSWADGKTWANNSFVGNSKLLVQLRIPMRNDSSSWGGGYTELQYSLNSGAFVSLGNSGYDGVMTLSSGDIGSVNYLFLLDIGTIAPYTCQFKSRHKSFDGTLQVNSNHDISGDEFYSKIIILEISKGI